MKTLPVLQTAQSTGDCCAVGDSSSAASAERAYPETEVAARLFHALADETRLAILKQLRDQGEVCACEFQACCRLAQPTISHHLKVLREAGLVTGEKRGLWVHYRLNEAALAQARSLLP